jgi:hypothetical protein
MGRNARRPGEIDGRAGVAKVYRILGYLIAAEVAVQAAAIAFASFGFSNWIDNGGVADLATFESDDTSFTGFVGYSFHGVNGALYVPILSLAFLGFSFFARSVPGGVTWAAIVIGLVAFRVFLGFASHSYVGLGALHGINAFALFVCALHAARRVTVRVQVPDQQSQAADSGRTR